MITRHYLTVEDRIVHYRRCGEGPALILLHASPVSSKVFEPLMRFYAQTFTTFAFDTPGNGLSDPLDLDDPDIQDYARAQVRALELLGVKRAIAYGRHTGASIAATMAEQRPDLITMAMTDGYPVFTEEERETYLSGYLNDLPVTDEGSHLTWLWNRYRDQFLFWPWNKRTADNLAACDMPDTEFIQNGVIALMEAGNNYKSPYRAVFKHDAIATLEQADAPICVAARPGDSLYGRFSRVPAQFWKETIPGEFAEASMRELDIMLPHIPDCAAPEIKPNKVENGMRRDFVTTGSDHLQVIEKEGPGRPIVFIGPAPGSLEPSWALLEQLSESRRLVAIEPAGCGESSAPGDGNVSIGRQADRVVDCVRQLGLEACDVVGLESGGAIALEAARRLRSNHLLLINPLLIDLTLRASLANAYAQDTAPQQDGTHLTRLWQEVRQSELFFPWFDARRVAARPPESIDLDPDRLTKKTLAFAKHAASHQRLWQTVWEYDWARRIINYAGRCSLVYNDQSLIPSHHIFDLVNLPANRSASGAEAMSAEILRVLDKRKCQ